MTTTIPTGMSPAVEPPDPRRRVGRRAGVALCAALSLALLAPSAAVGLPLATAVAAAPGDIAASDAAGVTIPNLDDVRGNIALPVTGAGGSTLSWASNDASVISADGLVERPAHGAGAVTVTLEATASFDGATATHDYVVTVTPLPAAEPYAAYFFPHFVGESTDDGEEITFAASVGNDPEEWMTLNDGESVLASTLGEQGLRDPFIIRSPEGDRFFLIATDLKIFGGGDFGTAQETGSRSIMVWESTDLVNWSDQREVVVAPENAGNTWAPEAYWDDAAGEYVVYWASALYPADLPPEQRDISTSYQRMMYATTRDFVTFSEPQVWIDEPQGAGRGMIDSTVARQDGVYYRLTKDESYMGMRQERSSDLRRTQGVAEGDGWELMAERIGFGQPNPWGGTFTGGEGPSVFQSNTDDTWYLLQDQPSYHGGEGYMLFETGDLASAEWTAMPSAKLPESPRHGTVIPVTASEYQRLLEAYQPDALEEAVTVAPVEISLAPGATRQLAASVTPVTAEDRSVTWSSSDESVATVDANGLVTAVADGVATITAASIRGTTGQAAITVASPAAPELPEDAWVDEFDADTLGDRWSITSETPSAWSLTENAGSLTLHSQNGDTYQGDNTADNVFLIDVPVGEFTAYTSVTGAVSTNFQGAGLIAMADLDNYVRAGLTNVSFAPGGPTVIENGVEENAIYRSSFTARPGSTHEYLRVQRTGDEIVTSHWTGFEWVEAARATVGFDVTRIGLYALAAGGAPSHEAVFDYFALVAPEGADLVPEGAFTLSRDGDATRLAEVEDTIRFVEERPFAELAFTAEELAGEASARPIALRDQGGDRPVVVRDGRVVFGGDADEPTAFRLTDVGGGRIALRTATGDAYVGVDAEGRLVVGDDADAARLAVVPVEIAQHSIAIDTAAERTDMSDDLYGIFYEDINYAADGGLYAELVRNRSFEFSTADNVSFNALTGWQKVERGATGTIAVGTDRARWLNDSNRASLTITAGAAGVGVRNIGFNRGIAVEEGESYDFSVWTRSAIAQDLTVAVESADGATRYAMGTVSIAGDDTWRQAEVRLTANATTDAGRLVVLTGAAGSVQLDMVSLFPVDTWVGPVNGPSVLRKDLAEKVAELDPSFLRFPGGCVTNVGTFDTYLESDGQDRQRTFQWKETIGPVEERPTNFNFWGYNQSYGIGYLEYMMWAEDLGATPLPVVSVGANGCGSNIPEMTDDARIARWVQDTVDLIEFATGDVTTEWGAKRAELGHPEPFDLRYIGLGNEENTDTFQANFPKFRDAIAAAYPEITIISNSGPDDTGARFDELWEFNRAQGVDLVDEHYYNDPQWFLQNSERYDAYDREGPHVFLGEYASRGNTFGNALAEAAYMTGLERNSDLVELASYAPMFANEDHVQWAPDMMWFDNDESWGSVNYYTQQMFMTNVGDAVVPSTHTESRPAHALDGGVFLSTWRTSAAYDDVRVTSNATGDVLHTQTFDSGTDWSPASGTWTVQGGEYVQSSTSVQDARALAPDAYAQDWSNYTLELDARKLAGSEGFLIGFAAGGANDYYWWNLGGWNNSRSVLQHASGGSANEVAAVENRSIQTGRDYAVKVVVEGSTIELYLDGVLQLRYTEPSAKGLYQVVTHDEQTGDTVLKVVNPTGATARTAVSVTGGMVVDDDVAVTEMVGVPGDVNTKADPEHLVPVDREWDGGANEFTYDFPAYSITFLSLSEHVPTCEVGYVVEGNSKKAFDATLTISNTGDEPIDGWELGFEFDGSQTVRNGRDAFWSQDGASVTATNLPWNGRIEPGASIEVGFNGRLNGGGNEPPTAFWLNGDGCGSGG
ncbi:alpha-L-arabinofuranosidase C-terminal domain-containing protein [Agromyces humatus]|uniref:non-reducing end alpha-L-arabinofuranosidase n=1 Tax=Agromyces humatus TaxID=279573 RepID=A0ABN2KYC3_9MICO|nr:alpha-L-arabinofuranosidase C-terminal domain-containing protein [Agromyces humatus]